MGSVIKATFEFKKVFWPHHDFGFIHIIGGRFPTWWSRGALPFVTAWAGGRRAEDLENASVDEIREEGLLDMCTLFGIDIQQAKDLLVTCHLHNWNRDPLARGAYSYTPAGMGHMAAELAEPLKDTLFFAGEATDTEGDQGTVHGALLSGRRAAALMLKARHHGKGVTTPGFSNR